MGGAGIRIGNRAAEKHLTETLGLGSSLMAEQVEIPAADRRSRHPLILCRGLVAACVRPLPFPHFLEAIMKAILSAAFVLALCGLAGAQGGNADPVGTWKCEYEIGGMKRMLTMTIKKDGD